MGALQAGYDAFNREANTGYMHAGGKCSGWFLSDLDTYHWCGACNRDGVKKENPEHKADREAQEAQDRNEQCLTASVVGKGMWVVVAPFNGESWARYLTESFAGAARWAAGFSKANKLTCKVVKMVDQIDIDQAEYQIERLADWASDIDIRE